MTDLYENLGAEVRELLQKPDAAKMEHIVKTARAIGGKVYEEALVLDEEVNAYLKKPSSKKLASLVKKHAFHINQETRAI